MRLAFIPDCGVFWRWEALLWTQILELPNWITSYFLIRIYAARSEHRTHDNNKIQGDWWPVTKRATHAAGCTGTGLLLLSGKALSCSWTNAFWAASCLAALFCFPLPIPTADNLSVSWFCYTYELKLYMEQKILLDVHLPLIPLQRVTDISNVGSFEGPETSRSSYKGGLHLRFIHNSWSWATAVWLQAIPEKT